MNRIIPLLLFLCLSCKISAQESLGVNFKKDYTAALELAKNENKLVFLYFNVPDCEPCNRLEKSFKNKSIGQLYNKHYMSFSLNANGDGKKMAEKYGVFSFPTLLYLTPKGVIKYSARGLRDGESIFEIGQLARLPARIIRRTMDDQYKSDPKDTDFLYDYIEYQYMRARFSKAEKILQVYFDQKDKIEKASWMGLVLDYATDPQSCANRVLIEEKDAFINEYGEGYINGIIWNSLVNKVGIKVSKASIAQFEQKFIEEAMKAGYDPKDDGLILFYSEYLFKSNVPRETGMPPADMATFTKYALAAIDIEDHIFDRDHLTVLSIHLLIFYQIDKDLKKLCQVLETNFEKDPHHIYPDLQAIALYIMGKEDEAVNKIVIARDLAWNQEKIDYKPSINVFKKLGIIKSKR